MRDEGTDAVQGHDARRTRHIDEEGVEEASFEVQVHAALHAGREPSVGKAERASLRAHEPDMALPRGRRRFPRGGAREADQEETENEAEECRPFHGYSFRRKRPPPKGGHPLFIPNRWALQTWRFACLADRRVGLSGLDDDGGAEPEQWLELPQGAGRDAEAPRAHGQADASGIVRAVDRELIAQRPSRRQVHLDPRDPEGERSVGAGGVKRDSIRHEVGPRRSRRGARAVRRGEPEDLGAQSVDDDQMP